MSAWQRKGGQFKVTSGRIQMLTSGEVSIFFPGRAFGEIRVRIRSCEGSGRLGLGMDDYQIRLGAPESTVSRCVRVPRILASTAICPRQEDVVFDLECTRSEGKISAQILDKEIFACADPLSHEPIALISLQLPEGLSFEAITVEGRKEEPIFQTTIGTGADKPRSIDVCIDLYDDLVRGAWSHRTFEHAMRYYKERGFRRVYFVDHFDRASGWWDQGAMDAEFQRNISQTFDHVGEDFLATAAGHARAQGLEFYSVIKPFESAMFYTLPEGSVEAGRHGKIHGLGGWHWWSPTFVAEHPEFRMARNPLDIHSSAKKVRSIVLTAETGMDTQFNAAGLKILVSKNNGVYEPYSGPLMVREEKLNGAHRVILDDLDIKERYFVLNVEGVDRRRFGNTLQKLVTVMDEDGATLPVTFSTRGNLPSCDFRKDGFATDVPGLGADTTELDDFFLFQNSAVLGIAIGYETHLQGALCPSHPEVRQWWMNQVARSIRAGVDGVDFRIKNHNRTYDWDAFGFNSPLVDEFAKRFGVDIRKEGFDREPWRRLRGEFYTQFLHDARRRLNENDKAMHLHIEPGMNDPAWHGSMEIHFDWEGWLSAGLADAITMKMIPSMHSTMACRIMQSARRAGNLPVNFNPSLFGLKNRGTDQLAALIDEAKNGGCNGFTMYENALFMGVKKDGSMEITNPWMVDAIFAGFAAK